jgi:hypothetical protein
MRLYIEDMNVGNSATPDDDDVSSIGNSLYRYVDSGPSVSADVDGMKERIYILGLSATDFIGVSVAQDSLTADLDVSLIQAAPPGSQPAPFIKDGDESKGWFISPSLCLPWWIRRAPTWLQILVIGSLILLITSIVVAGIALGEINNASSQSNAILGVSRSIPTSSPVRSPITIGQTNDFSPTVNVQDQINESQPTSSPSSPLKSGPNNIFSPTNNIQDQIENSPQLGLPSTPPESGSSVPTTATAAGDCLPRPPTSAPTTNPTQLPPAQPLDESLAPSSSAMLQFLSSSAPTIHPTQLPSTQPMDASSAPSSSAMLQFPSSSSVPTIHPTQLPSAQPMDASSTPFSPATLQLLSKSIAPTTHPTQLPSAQPVDTSSAPLLRSPSKKTKKTKRKRRHRFRPPS